MTVRENLEMGAYLRGARRRRRTSTACTALPAAARAAQPARRDAVGRRAADGRDGPRADVPAEAAAHGRAVDGARADPGRAELRDHQAGARGRRRRSSSSSRTRTSRSRSPTAATSCRRAASCSAGPAKELLEHEDLQEGVPRPVGHRLWATRCQAPLRVVEGSKKALARRAEQLAQADSACAGSPRGPAARSTSAATRAAWSNDHQYVVLNEKRNGSG